MPQSKRGLFFLFSFLPLLLIACEGGYGNGYDVREDGVYYAETDTFSSNPNVWEIKEADVSTFEVFGNWEYARDANHVYFAGVRVDEADSASLEVFLSGRYGDYAYYAKDKDRVFAGGEILPAADWATFKIVEQSNYALDKNQVYFVDTVIPNAHPNSFEAISFDLARDENDYYNNGNPMNVCDMDSFTLENEMGYQIWGHDAQCYYLNYENIPLPDNSTNFELLDGGYARDDKRIYFLDKIVTEADVTTFATERGDTYFLARDADHCFDEGQISECPEISVPNQE